LGKAGFCSGAAPCAYRPMRPDELRSPGGYQAPLLVFEGVEIDTRRPHLSG